MKRRLSLRRQLPGVGGKFGVLLPAQSGAAERDAVLLGRRLERLEFATGAEIGQRRAVGLGGVAGGIEGKVQDAARGIDGGKWARMHLAQHRRAQAMRGELRAAVDGDVRRHAHPVARERNFGKTGKNWRKNCFKSGDAPFARNIRSEHYSCALRFMWALRASA